MFVNRLSDANCNAIFEKLLCSAFNNETMARFYMMNSRLIRYDEMAKLQFFDVSSTSKKGRYTDIAHFTDFSAEVGVNSKRVMNPTQVNSTFRREMFREFGKDYYNAYDDLYRRVITDRYFRDLSAHNEIMADMTRSKDEENHM